MELAKYLELHDALVDGRGSVVVEFNGRTASTVDELNFIAAAERLSISREQADDLFLLFGEYDAAIVREPEVPTAPPAPVVAPDAPADVMDDDAPVADGGPVSAGLIDSIGERGPETMFPPVADDAPVVDVPVVEDAPPADAPVDVTPEKPKKGK